jgi:hypothetical protein
MANSGLTDTDKFVVKEYPCTGKNRDGITFLVSFDGVILFTREYTRHRAFADQTGYSLSDIAWGGILTEKGTWVRRSFDFGDAPDPEIREQVVFSIQKWLAHTKK